MNWRRQLRAAWASLPASARRLLVVALLAATALILISFSGERDVQLAAVLGLFALFVVVQIVILWLVWRQNPEFRQARRAFLNGEFDDVVAILAPLDAAGTLDVGGAALLGNAYRQLGRLDDSAQLLRGAHEADPESPFAAYGLGRTLLAQGVYAEAAAMIAHALDKRGQPVIAADLGHAYYRAGQHDEALAALQRADRLELEPHRALLTRYLLWQLQDEPADDELIDRLTRVDHGLALWQAEAERFQMTPYGAALAEDVETVTQLLAEQAGQET